ncbi:MAG: ArsR/SmtB family transcription factor [Desulfobacterales bacterium]|jgi:ArsR family transcriptional regulator
MKTLIKVMKALSDPNRVKIIKLLQHKSLCVCEIQSALGHSQPNISKHLRILQEAGLVESSKDGLWVNYRLTDGRDSPFAAVMLANLRHWLEGDAEIRELIDRIGDLDRFTLCRN